MFPFLQSRWIYRLNHEHDAASSALVCTNSEERGYFLGLFLSRLDFFCVFFLYFPLGQHSNAVPTCVTESFCMFGVFLFLSLRLVLLSSRFSIRAALAFIVPRTKMALDWRFLLAHSCFFLLGCGFALPVLGPLIFLLGSTRAGRWESADSFFFRFFLELRYGWNNVFSA